MRLYRPGRQTLNANQVIVATLIGTARQKANERAHVRDAKMSDRPSVEIHIDGFGGELAFCQLFNLFPDFSTEPRSTKNGTDGFDAYLCGHWIDTKANPRSDGDLLVKASKADGLKWPDYYALMTGRCPHYWFRGFMPAAEVLRPERLRDLGKGPTYLVPQSELLHEIPGVFCIKTAKVQPISVCVA